MAEPVSQTYRLPSRIQRSRAKGWRMPEGAVYVGRPTVFGNPWVCSWPYGCPKSPDYDHGHEPDGTPSMHCCQDVFREWLRQGVAGEPSRLIGRGGGIRAALMAMTGNEARTKLVEALPRLRSKALACWCAVEGKPCHADVLLELANVPLRCDPA
jgi:hypothetical protein